MAKLNVCGKEIGSFAAGTDRESGGNRAWRGNIEIYFPEILDATRGGAEGAERASRSVLLYLPTKMEKLRKKWLWLRQQKER